MTASGNLSMYAAVKCKVKNVVTTKVSAVRSYIYEPPPMSRIDRCSPPKRDSCGYCCFFCFFLRQSAPPGCQCVLLRLFN